MRISDCKVFPRLDLFNTRKDNPERLEIEVVGKKEELENLIKLIHSECAK